MNIKQMLKDGYHKEQLYLVITKDINGKTHFFVVEDIDTVKKYKSSSNQVQQISILKK